MSSPSLACPPFPPEKPRRCRTPRPLDLGRDVDFSSSRRRSKSLAVRSRRSRVRAARSVLKLSLDCPPPSGVMVALRTVAAVRRCVWVSVDSGLITLRRWLPSETRRLGDEARPRGDRRCSAFVCTGCSRCCCSVAVG